MPRSPFRPALRPVESILVPDAQHGRVLVLRDTEGITEGNVCVPPGLIPIVARFTGEKTCEQIAAEVSRELGQKVDVETVSRAAKVLEDALFLEGPSYRAARDEVVRAFSTSPTRAASHAGGAYLSDPTELRAYLDTKCLATAGANGGAPRDKKMVALVSPHIDPWRGAVGYGHAYATLARDLSPDADTFVVFGTSHAPMREPFALCRKAFDTPLGAMEADEDAIDAIARATAFDVYADELNHKREHSIEFQIVFLKHVLGKRRARIIPILAGLGESQATRTDPTRDARATRFLDAVRGVVEGLGPRAVLVAGADMAHVGPRFGDPRPFDEAARARLAGTDRESLAHAAEGDAPGFWSHVARDLETRRVCGLGPIYSLLQAMPQGAQGELLHYEQTVDADDGSIVSHAALGFYAA
jgi:AmmeMemoRadiSam system protein B